MKILVTGANGQLGNEMRIVSRQSDTDFLFTDVCQSEGQDTVFLDITDSDAVREIVSKNDVRIIVNCAAYTNVDAAETNYELAERLNADAPEILAIAMKEVGGLLVHISTDYVFGREPYNVPCRENQVGTPTGVYGLTKLHGEERILATGCDSVIIRTAWLYSEFGRNFCKTMLSLIASRPRLDVVFDQVGTPTYAYDLACAIVTIIKDYKVNGNRNCGVYHFSNEGVCSWFDFTKMIQLIDNELRISKGLEPTVCDVQPCHSNEFPSPVVRPSYSVLDKTKIKQVFGVSVPYWTESLRRCIGNLNGR